MRRPVWVSISSIAGILLLCCGISGICTTTGFAMAVETPVSPAYAQEASPTANFPAPPAPTNTTEPTAAPHTIEEPTANPPPEQPADTLEPTLEPAPTQQATTAPAGVLRVSILDVGQGLGVLIIAPNGEAALFDGGPTEAGEKVVAYLIGSGVTRLKYYIISHPHEDHIGVGLELLGRIPIETVITNGQPHTTATYEHWLDAVLATDAAYVETGLGGSFPPLGGINLEFFNPLAPQPKGDLNEFSLVLHFRYGQVAFLLEGDADHGTELSMVRMGLDLKADVLQAGHHCSRSASSPVFLSIVKPTYAVCSEGAGNQYGHPHPETLQSLLDAGATVFRTDLNGTVTFFTDGATLNVQEER